MRWQTSCKADRKGKIRKMVENNIGLNYFLFERILENEKKIETMGNKDWGVEERKTEITWKSRGKYKEQETNSRNNIERVRKTKEKKYKEFCILGFLPHLIWMDTPRIIFWFSSLLSVMFAISISLESVFKTFSVGGFIFLSKWLTIGFLKNC